MHQSFVCPSPLGGRGGLSQTDVLVILYLLVTECSNWPFHSKGTKISKEGVQVFFKALWGQGRGGVWRSLYLFLKKPVTLVFFFLCVCVCVWGGGGGERVRISWPPTSLWIHNSEIKRIYSKDRCSPNIRLFNKGCKLISLIVLMLCSGQNSGITKGNNF